MDEIKDYLLQLLRDNADIACNGEPYGISFKQIEKIFENSTLNIDDIQN